MEVFKGSAEPAGNPGAAGDVTPAADNTAVTPEPKTPVTPDPAKASDPVTPAAPTGDWRDGLPDDLRASKGLEKFKDKAALATSYLELERKIGAKGLIIPKPDAPQEEVDAFFNALGRPETPEKYEVEFPADYPEVLKNDERVGEFRGVAHKLGLSAEQVKGVIDFYVKGNMADHGHYVGQMKEAKESAETALRTEWGEAFEPNCQVVLDAYNQFADQEFVEYLESSGVGNDPRMARMFYKIGLAMSEDGKLKGGDVTSIGGSFEAQRVALMGHPAFKDQSHKDYRQVQDKLAALYAKEYPEKQA